MALEITIFAAGVGLYLRSTKASDAIGECALRILLGLLVFIQIANSFGPPPPNVSALAWMGQAQWLLVAWGHWVDRHRQAATADRTFIKTGAT